MGCYNTEPLKQHFLVLKLLRDNWGKKNPAKSVCNISEKIYEILKKDNVTSFSSYKMEKEKKSFQVSGI